MGKVTGFLEYERRGTSARPVAERRRDWREVHGVQPEPEVSLQGARCMDCGIPFCQGDTGCPLGNLIPEWNDLVFRSAWDEAVERLHATNNFPEITGRICPAPCEKACTLEIDREPVAIKRIEAAVAAHALEAGLEPRPAARKTGKRVAVVGSGPAGLAAAQQLARAGHAVTVFERQNRPGGLLRYGIPDFKLDRSVLDRRLAQMEAEGVRFVTGVEAGVDVTARELLTGHDAVLLAMGCEAPRDLPVPGRDLAGVCFALDFLRQQNRRVAGETVPPEEEILATGRRVVVLGGGDTGSDCVGTALRQGADSVVNLELLPRPPNARSADPPWPWWPHELVTSHAHEEGGERRWSVLTQRFTGDGRVSGLDAVEVTWGRDPETGRPVMEGEVPGSEMHLPCDLVLLALGYVQPVRGGLVAGLAELGMALTPSGHVATDRAWRTSLETVFAAGDATRGQSLVVSAISDGRRAARAVDLHLMGASDLPAGPPRDLPDMLASVERSPAIPREEREASLAVD